MEEASQAQKPAMPSLGHMMAADDPDNPLNWPVNKKIYVSIVSFAFTYAVSVPLCISSMGSEES